MSSEMSVMYRMSFPVGIDKTAVEPLCLPVVVQTSPTYGRFDEITGWL